MIMHILMHIRKKIMALFRASFICLLLLFSLGTKAFAKGVKLKTTLVKLSTDHGLLLAEIHFDERDILIAQKVENIVKHHLTEVINYFRHVPKSIVHFNVDPYMRRPNGNATVIPSNVINLYNFPSNNEDHLIVMEDWFKGLVIHEFIHITHLDQTRGYLESIRQIFGTIAKFPNNLVPRWFTEGIAVWGETHLMKAERAQRGGRLNSALFRKEFLIQFLKEDFCKSIDCLDDPGQYPHGQLPYWAGAHFIEYLENLRAGTVRCLVEVKSSAIPFILNPAFEDCSGKTAQEHFQNFRSDLIAKAEPSAEAAVAKDSWGDKISNAFGSDDFQKGILLDGDMLYKIERDRYTEALVVYDLSESNGLGLATPMVKQKYTTQISDLVGLVSLENADQEQTKYLVMSFIEDPNYRKESKVWKLVNAETLLIERSLNFKNDPSYVIALENNNYITASYLDNHWKIEKQQLSEEHEGEVVEVKTLHTFPSRYNIVGFSKANDRIFLKINDGEASVLSYSDLSLEKFYVIYKNFSFYDLPILEESFVVIDQKDSYRLIELKPNNTQSQPQANYSLLRLNVLKNVTKALIREERAVLLENGLKTKVQSLRDNLSFIKKDQTALETLSLDVFEWDKADADVTQLITENYPQLYHLSPNYWFLAMGNFDSLYSIGAITTLKDPMELHTLDATVLAYPSIAKIGGSLAYLHKLSTISDLWRISAFLKQEYFRTEVSQTLIDSSEISLGTSYTFLLQNWTETPGIFVATSRDNNFILARTTNSVGLRNSLSYEALTFNSLFQKLSTQIKIQNDFPESGENFLNFDGRVLTKFRFYDRLSAQINLAYGRLFKSDGVLRGGGNSDPLNHRSFEFYGVPYGNAYGNELFTFRLMGEYNFWNIYRGYQFLPVFFKEAILLFGREALYADRIFLDNSFFKEKVIHSSFAGLRMKINLFYHFPTDIDLIFSSTAHSNGRNVEAVSFSLNAELF